MVVGDSKGGGASKTRREGVARECVRIIVVAPPRHRINRLSNASNPSSSPPCPAPLVQPVVNQIKLW